MGKSRLKLELTTAAGTDLNDFVRIELVSAQDSNHYQANLRVARSVVIEDIEANPSTVYRVTVMPSNHRIVQFFAMLREGLTAEQTVACPVDPARVTSLQAPSYEILAEGARELLAHSEIPRFSTEDGAFLQGLELYRALDSTPKLKACLLNIITKSAATVLRNGNSCLQHLSGLIRVEPDRIFARTTAALREEVQNSPLFHPVSGALHTPAPGYSVTDSYKTLDRYGNLQLTFQRHGESGDDYLADVDIDDAQGVEHIFQVVRNSVHGPTDPYDIHDILQADQKLDPGYSFVFPRAAVAG